MNKLSDAGKLHEALAAAGVPIDGCAVLALGEPPKVRIDFCTECTLEQKSQAQAIAADMSATAWWRERGVKERNELIFDIGAMKATDRQMLIALAVADWVRSNPDMPQKFGISLDPYEAPDADKDDVSPSMLKKIWAWVTGG